MRSNAAVVLAVSVLFAALPAAALSAPSPHAGCARHRDETVTLTVPVSARATGLRVRTDLRVRSIATPLASLQPAALIRAMLGSNMPAAEAAAACPHQAQVDAWFAWRHRNPHAHSRYARGNRINTLQLDRVNLVASLNYGNGADPEPSPDPMFGGCGCSEEVALATGGCGWWHANVYGLSSQ